MDHRCFGLTKNLNRCQRRGDWRFFCPEHTKQPIVWIVFLVFTIGAGSASIISYLKERSFQDQIHNNYTLTAKQKAIFVETLKRAKDPKEVIKLGCAGNDANACVFAGQLFGLFREAGWVVEGNKVERVMLGVPLPGIALFRRGEGKLDPSNPKSGLWVKQTDSLSIVRASFKKVGFSVESKAEAKFIEDVIGVFVGPYPQ